MTQPRLRKADYKKLRGMTRAEQQKTRNALIAEGDALCRELVAAHFQETKPSSHTSLRVASWEHRCREAGMTTRSMDRMVKREIEAQEARLMDLRIRAFNEAVKRMEHTLRFGEIREGGSMKALIDEIEPRFPFGFDLARPKFGGWTGGAV